MSRTLPWVVLAVAAAVALYFGGSLLLPLDNARTMWGRLLPQCVRAVAAVFATAGAAQ